MPTTFTVEGEFVQVPDAVTDLGSFRRWFHSDDFPEYGRICFLKGEVWVDMSRAQIFTHNQVKQAFNLTLGGLAKSLKKGRFFPDGLMVVNPDADLASQPDGTFVSFESFAAERVRLVEGAQEGCLELEGSPDMVLEIVSKSSVDKDTEILPELYWRAGIAEHWLVDARKDPVRFDIYRRGKNGYEPVKKQGGWLKSTVFGKSFRLTRGKDQAGNPEYALAVR